MRNLLKSVTNPIRLLPLLILGSVTACNNDSGVRNMSDFELAQRHSECLERNPTAPGRAQACENVRRECDRRRQELRTFICATR